MLFTTHIVVGSAVGLATGNPIAGFFAALASHHLCDKIPHFDSGSFYLGKEEPKFFSDYKWPEKLIVIADFIIGITFFLWLLKLTVNPAPDIYIGDLWTKNNSIIFWSTLGSIAADILYNGARIIRHKTSWFWDGKPLVWYHRFHEWTNSTISLQYWYIGLLVQIVLIIGSLWFIFWKLKI